MLKTLKPAAVFSISIPGDIGGHGARGVHHALPNYCVETFSISGSFQPLSNSVERTTGPAGHNNARAVPIAVKPDFSIARTSWLLLARITRQCRLTGHFKPFARACLNDADAPITAIRWTEIKLVGSTSSASSLHPQKSRRS
jgi:hypothetical protein